MQKRPLESLRAKWEAEALERGTDPAPIARIGDPTEALRELRDEPDDDNPVPWRAT